MRKQTETLLLVLGAVALGSVIITDPIAFDFLSEWWLVIVSLTAAFVANGVICYLVGLAHGKKSGVSQGYWLRDNETRR